MPPQQLLHKSQLCERYNSTITTLIIMYKPNLLSSFIIKERRRAKQVGRFLLFSTKKDALLFTPGPLTTSATVKAAMLRDAGSRDPNFLDVIRQVRKGLLSIGGVKSTSDGGLYECVITQGSGTFGVESVIGSVVPKTGGKLLVASNGAYGDRMVKIAKVLGIPVDFISFHERGPVDVNKVLARVKSDSATTHVAVVHHETTAGVLNDIHSLGEGLRQINPKLTYIVDSMSAFGAYPVHLEKSNIHFLVSSSNKCIEGVPGFSYTLASRERLEGSKNNARSLSLDLYEQWRGLEATGEFRFTPPVHALLAFKQALVELEEHGGAPGRLERYQNNAKTLVDGMRALGFSPYVDESNQGCIITTFLVPDDPKFNFKTVYNKLEERGFIIYPGKTTKAESFRLGSIGRLFDHDMRAVVQALKEVLIETGVSLPVIQKRE